MVITIFNGLFLLAFVLSASVQYNDPDGLLWIGLYTAAAAMCLAHQMAKLPHWLPLTMLIIALVWIGVLLPNIVGQVSLEEIAESISMKTKDVEEAREIGGLAIVALWSAVLSFRGAN